ncbi:toll/interleukin-1 receptor domain-containing protein [Vibrio algivorus]|uniref:TIR domain-containing protein n=1 Tax=Vibrio algivorus TaxID=1667024 RepID=A0A557NYG8_9VIBR|nr:toll/interleukin-1 receptor domain-containing protein [Vibrio algivorus]TVO33460.1 TIR domain-containing protein [Vibrio algivorus]
MDTPKVFISYSHDSENHKKWVLELATYLRNCGIDSILDQWDLRPGDDLNHFMEKHLSTSDYIIVVCTEKYVEKANHGSGGVGYEKMIITSELMSNIDSNKVIPLIKQYKTKIVPICLKTKLFIDFSEEDLESIPNQLEVAGFNT